LSGLRRYGDLGAAQTFVCAAESGTEPGQLLALREKLLRNRCKWQSDCATWARQRSEKLNLEQNREIAP
jgi:hypothetical protein